MKKYKLKQWYPSLALTWSTEDRYEYDASRQVMVNISNVKKEVVIPQRIVKERDYTLLGGRTLVCYRGWCGMY